MVFLTIYSCQTVGAAKVKTKKVAPEELLQKGREAFFNYEFEEAADLFDEYEELQTKAKKPIDENLEEWRKQLNIATNAFGRVQRIVVIDSINMPRATFYKAYKLLNSAGMIGRVSDFKITGLNTKEVGFINEDRDYFIFPENDSSGRLILKEYRTLLDGSVESMEALEGDFEQEGDYAYPFLCGDGLTLYFSNDGTETMGGYDLFVAQKEPISGESLQPLNLGMPFNSPYDDFMMAIDVERGLGWWATDRNSPGGDVTIYVYILDDLRKNYPADTEDLVNFAQIKDYKSTWEDGKEAIYEDILSIIKHDQTKR